MAYTKKYVSVVNHEQKYDLEFLALFRFMILNRYPTVESTLFNLTPGNFKDLLALYQTELSTKYDKICLPLQQIYTCLFYAMFLAILYKKNFPHDPSQECDLNNFIELICAFICTILLRLQYDINSSDTSLIYDKEWRQNLYDDFMSAIKNIETDDIF